MSRKRIVLAAALALYGTVTVVTFGRAAAQSAAWYQANCTTLMKRADAGSQCYEPYVGNALFAGLLWPLYWSWEAWDDA